MVKISNYNKKNCQVSLQRYFKLQKLPKIPLKNYKYQSNFIKKNFFYLNFIAIIIIKTLVKTTKNPNIAEFLIGLL